MEIRVYVGTQIRSLREAWNGGAGMSQDELARLLGTTANTISRWETATYRPSVEELDRLARAFRVSIAAFFPSDIAPPENEKLHALLRTARDLPESDIEELQRFAEWRHFAKRYPGLPSKKRAKSTP
jgi:transcriptional regulator with XRE-family HTH domain